MSDDPRPPSRPAPGVSRRQVLGAAAAGAAAFGGFTAGSGTARASAVARAAAVPVTLQRERVVVVGSGFGGGVTALRLAEAGVPALVLERGRRWVTGPNATTFCRFAGIDNRSAWLSATPTVPGVVKVWDPYVGVIEKIDGNGMTVNCGAAVGGGSINYHGMSLQPDQSAFALSIPLMADHYDELNRTQYPTVARMLGLSTIPDDIFASDPYKSSRLFWDVAPKAGLDRFKVALPVDWSFVRGELDGRYAPTYTTSDIAFGVNNGGKHSIDVTYLAAAESTGLVTVAPLHIVRDIAMDPRKRWVLYVDRIDTGGKVLERKIITADAVFLNAGSAGTTRLMVKAKAKGLIPGLPDAVGTQWGNNGDRIYQWIGMDGDAGTVQGGPACVGGRDPQSPIPLTVIHAGSPALIDGVKMLTVVGFGINKPAGTWSYDALADDAKLTWPSSGDADLQKLIGARMNDLTRAGGGVMVDTNATGASTWHGLGGVPMGGAVDTAGRVLGHSGLYVMDGARIPGSTGACNPSMTIAALAEHSLATIVREDVGKAF